MLKATIHFAKSIGGFACDFRRGIARSTRDPNGVTCGRCKRTAAFRIALREWDRPLGG